MIVCDICRNPIPTYSHATKLAGATAATSMGLREVCTVCKRKLEAIQNEEYEEFKNRVKTRVKELSNFDPPPNESEESIDVLDLSVRSSNCLKYAGILTVSELRRTKPSELFKLEGFGKKSMREVLSAIEKYELGTGVTEDEKPTVHNKKWTKAKRFQLLEARKTHTLKELGQMHGVCPQRISQVIRDTQRRYKLDEWRNPK